ARERLPRVQRVVPRQPDEAPRVRRRARRQLPRVPEDELERAAVGAESLRRREREVDLEPVGEQDDAEEGRAPLQVPVVHRAELVLEQPRPVPDDGGPVGIVREPERDVDVRPLVLVPGGGGADERGGDDPVVALGALEQERADAGADDRVDYAVKPHTAPKRRISATIGSSASPLAVSWYSTRGGDSG